jgi:predicted acylesterase/phospholipase RssA
MTIKHLVISGGGPTMIQTLGAIYELEKSNYIHLSDIESIYGTSAGGIVATLIALKYDDLNTVNDYVIKRPWHDVFKINVELFFIAYTQKGFFDMKTIEKVFKPLFDAKDISLDINLEDFYKISKIELHFYTFEINEFHINDISYLTHPTLRLLTAVHMTCSIPVFFTPVCIDNKCYIDGGIVCNYPVKYCIDNTKNQDEILGFKNKHNETKSITDAIDEKSTLLEYVITLLYKVIQSFSKINNIETILKNEIIYEVDVLSLHSLSSAISDIDIRKNLFESGINSAKEYIANTKLKDSL